MSCLEAFIIYTAKGDPIIFRVYKDNIEYATSLCMGHGLLLLLRPVKLVPGPRAPCMG